jgi:MADS-box transcription factor
MINFQGKKTTGKQLNQILLLFLHCRHMLGEDLSVLTIPDLLQLEQQLDIGSSRVQARKVNV